MKPETNTEQKQLSFDEFKHIVLNDYRVANESRQASMIGA